MSTDAKKAEFLRQLQRLDLHKRGKIKMKPRELIRIRLRLPPVRTGARLSIASSAFAVFASATWPALA